MKMGRVQSKELRLLIVTEDPHQICCGDIYTSNSVNLFFMGLSEFYKSVRFSCPTAYLDRNQDPSFNNRLTLPKNVEWSARPYFYNKKDIFKKPLAIILSVVSLYRDMASADIILYRLPSPYILFVYVATFLYKNKMAVYIAGDFYGRNYSRSRWFGSKALVLLYDILERSVARRVKALATGSYLCKKYRAKPFFTTLIDVHDIRQTPRPLNKRPRIIYVGRLDKNKGVDDLLHAITVLNNNNFDLDLTVIGSGPERGQLTDLAIQLGLRNVMFTGQLDYGDELFFYYDQSDVFVLPSHNEGVPKVLFEAMAHALSIVATNVGGIPDYVTHMETGLLVPPGEPEQLASAIKTLLTNSALRNYVVKNALAIVKELTIESLQRKLVHHLIMSRS